MMVMSCAVDRCPASVRPCMFLKVVRVMPTTRMGTRTKNSRPLIRKAYSVDCLPTPRTTMGGGVLTLMARRATRTQRGTLVAGIAVLIGMWLERFNIVVPTSVNPIWELETLGRYFPTWIELSIMAATFAGFVLLYMIATKFIPIVSIWEIEEGREHSVTEVSERVASYLPDSAITPVGGET